MLISIVIVPGSMRTLEEIFGLIDDSYDDMVRTMIEMIRYPALCPFNGGDGEGCKADYLQGRLCGFDSVTRYDVPDRLDPSVMRANILAKKNGKKPGTVWVVAHMDVVPTGDPALWTTPPFEPELRDGKIYGRGTEDNGQSIISSMFASRFLLDQELEGMSIGVAYVADEETGSVLGIQYLLDKGLFSEDDVIMVPDWGSPGGSLVEVSEKHMLWLRFEIEGKTTHGSTPNMGINAFRVSTNLLADLMDKLEKRFDCRNEIFQPPYSTFEPTRRPATVDNVNTIPGHDEFYMDMRILPSYDLDEIIGFVGYVVKEHEDRTGAMITLSITQREESGKPSSTQSKGFKALSEAVRIVTGNIPGAIGVGGGTCANLFRKKGFDAYVWQCGGGTLHAPDEHVVMSNMITDTKVFATLYYNLCLKG